MTCCRYGYLVRLEFFFYINLSAYLSRYRWTNYSSAGISTGATDTCNFDENKNRRSLASASYVHHASHHFPSGIYPFCPCPLRTIQHSKIMKKKNERKKDTYDFNLIVQAHSLAILSPRNTSLLLGLVLLLVVGPNVAQVGGAAGDVVIGRTGVEADSVDRLTLANVHTLFYLLSFFLSFLSFLGMGE